ncbi:putative PurR-regulated permease PerM [Paraburkholderia silvatlantica]|uniref:PurR-regulated permease PerM n=2 Tax=Paraburkholderia silvatlantica TaxID=321895 RepID=A0ABR6FGG0_9BURK|nr:putative PurR-regulated permease PerM [Paraburkholderia silvatlantica]PVY33443.1 putative PurR-regulated permease PerM [Paraburkholderia silvatlantica]PXW38383.1 putative PurR-regulated permease PerM [Paraburkholderia silvatlantica]
MREVSWSCGAASRNNELRTRIRQRTHTLNASDRAWPDTSREHATIDATMTAYYRQSLFWGAVALSAGVLLWSLRSVLTPFLLGAMIAYVLQPGVEWLVRRRSPRGLAALVMMSIFVALLALLVLLVFVVVRMEGSELTGQISSLASKLEGAGKPWLASMGIDYWPDWTSLRATLAARLMAGEHDAVLAVWQYLRTGGSAMVDVVGNLVILPLVLFYLLYDRPEALERLESFVPRRWLAQTRDFVAGVDHMMSQYLRGQLAVVAVLAVFYPAALTIAGLRIALPVGLLTALAVVVPYIGFATALASALFAAVLQFGNWYGVGAVALVYGIGQILESVVLTPRLVGERIGLHPLAVIFSLLAFGKVFGFFGVLLALPASAACVSALRELRRHYLTTALYRD